jgi:hypothetical protein
MRPLGAVELMLLALASAAGCVPRGASKNADPEATSSPHPSADIYESMDGAGIQSVRGAGVFVGEFGSPCRLEASWDLARIGPPPGLPFQATIVSQVGGIFALPDGMVRLALCEGATMHGRMMPPLGVLELDPPISLAWAALGEGNVIIPLGGDATLDQEFRATATLEPESDAGLASVTVNLTGPSPLPAVHRRLHRGDVFAWGKTQAKIVRIIEPASKLVGWIEIALSAS